MLYFSTYYNRVMQGVMLVKVQLNSRHNIAAIQKDMQINKELGIVKILRGSSPITTLAWENSQTLNCLI